MNIPTSKKKQNIREEVLTGALCQALIIKKGVCPDRFHEPVMEKEQIQCPEDCHACCTSSAILDLTSAESLTIYLINREIVNVMDEETILLQASGYCPFLIRDKCIINAYKPSACQMYMPFEHEGKPMCFYIAEYEPTKQQNFLEKYYTNSNSYAIHGCMLIAQHDIDKHLSHPYFKNIYEGVLWWKKNYNLLPRNTQFSLESILDEDAVGLRLMDSFKFEESLTAGHKTYTDMSEEHTRHPERRLTGL